MDRANSSTQHPNTSIPPDEPTMPIHRASFGLVTQLLDLTAAPAAASSRAAWAPMLERVRDLGAGAMAEEVARGNDATVTRFLELQQAAQRQGLETFLRLRE